MKSEPKKWHFRVTNDPELFKKETFIDRIDEIRFAIEEFRKLYEKAPSAGRLFRAKVLKEIELSKKNLSQIQAEYEMFKKYKTRTAISK